MLVDCWEVEINAIIALWSHPRSMSTVIERVVRARGDLDCLHEPFMYFYYVERRIREMPHFDVDPTWPTTYESIREHLLEKAGRQPVFLKDMSYYVIPQIFEDTSFAERLTNCFLIRDPMKSILSYYKLDPGVTLEEIGLEAQWHHFEWLRSTIGQRPVVIDAEAVRANPVPIISALWKLIDLAFCARAFSWSNQEVPGGWDRVLGWHGKATSSNTILPPDTEQEAETHQRFDVAATHAPQLRDYLEHHRPFYDKLLAHALTA